MTTNIVIPTKVTMRERVNWLEEIALNDEESVKGGKFVWDEVRAYVERFMPRWLVPSFDSLFRDWVRDKLRDALKAAGWVFLADGRHMKRLTDLTTFELRDQEERKVRFAIKDLEKCRADRIKHAKANNTVADTSDLDRKIAILSEGLVAAA
jgi:hypothetical protein